MTSSVLVLLSAACGTGASENYGPDSGPRDRARPDEPCLGSADSLSGSAGDIWDLTFDRVELVLVPETRSLSGILETPEILRVRYLSGVLLQTEVTILYASALIEEGVTTLDIDESGRLFRDPEAVGGHFSLQLEDDQVSFLGAPEVGSSLRGCFKARILPDRRMYPVSELAGEFEGVVVEGE